MILPWSILEALKRAGWPQRKRGLHIAPVAGGRDTISEDFRACPSAHELFGALISEGYAYKTQETLARLWIELHGKQEKKLPG